MTYLVPYDGSDLADAALATARDHARADGRDLVAVVVIPRSNVRYAREKGWLDEGQSFDREAIEDGLESRARSIAPEVGFKVADVDRFGHRARIANAVGRVAARVDVHTVYLGSEKAGGSVVPSNSVGGDIANDPDVDIHVVRSAEELGRRVDSEMGFGFEAMDEGPSGLSDAATPGESEDTASEGSGEDDTGVSGDDAIEIPDPPSSGLADDATPGESDDAVADESVDAAGSGDDDSEETADDAIENSDAPLSGLVDDVAPGESDDAAAARSGEGDAGEADDDSIEIPDPPSSG